MTCEVLRGLIEWARLRIAGSLDATLTRLSLPGRKWWILAATPVALAAVLILPDRTGKSVAGAPASSERGDVTSYPAPSGGLWRDRFGDGWPDTARLDRPEDRENFRQWITYLAESAYYQPSPLARAEVTDCAALIRYAYRNALMAHTAAWRQSMELTAVPGFGDVTKFSYPDWPMGRGLFRTKAGPFVPEDLELHTFQEFADAQTLMRYNTFAVSRDLMAARPGDIIFFRQPEQAEPFHAMLFVGKSHYQAQGGDWLIYHTGGENGKPGEIRHVQASVLARHPELRWHPIEANPRFLGVYRFDVLR